MREKESLLPGGDWGGGVARGVGAGVLAEVQPLSGFGEALTYAVPTRMEPDVAVGSLVRVPLGRRVVLGVVFRVGEGVVAPEGCRLRAVLEVVRGGALMTPELPALAQWMAGYYGAGMEAVLEAMLPGPVREGVRESRRRVLRVLRVPQEAELAEVRRRAPRQVEVFVFVRAQGGAVERAWLLGRLGVAGAVVDGLVRRGWLAEVAEVVERGAYGGALAEAEREGAVAPVLNDEQRAAAADIVASVRAGGFGVHLLHGVTGSGKTEVYLEAVREALACGGGVIFLVPEVALTPQTVGRLRVRLEGMGLGAVVWHSQLSAGERLDGWLRVARGEGRVVVGARSAVFAPVRHLRLVVVDEEHEPAYKQSEVPRYHGRDVAVYRAMLCGATCVLGSATPSLESLYNVRRQRYRLNVMRRRVDDRSLPKVQLVDMKFEVLRSKGGGAVVSGALAEALRLRVERGEQAILFLNRRGYSSAMLCPECGYVAMSPDTSVPMTYHRTDDTLRCHLTGYVEPAPRVCPKCGSEKIRWRGFGTQKVEELLRRLVPGARVARVDTDSMGRKDSLRHTLAEFRQGRLDILVGTQMIAKGLDFPGVTLVGVLDADLSLHMPDFRAAERTFQLLVQVAGRAGRGGREGEVLVQTFDPSSAPVQFARRGDGDGFVEAELAQREEFGYPPYRHLVRHVFRSRSEERARFFIEQWARRVEEALGTELELRGPAPAPLEVLRGQYRFQLWYFMSSVARVMPRLLALRAAFPLERGVVEVLDVDAVEML